MLYKNLRILALSCGLLGGVFSVSTAFAQSESNVADKVAGIDERLSTLESTVDKMSKLKISGYIQPQWVWSDADSLLNQVATRNYFQIRRGRFKLTHSSGNISYTLYPDIIETGVTLKEVFATWSPIEMLTISMGAMNRPFGYEIGYSSSAREVAERSQAEQRLFNGERDLGLQFALAPTFGSIKPMLEVGLFNGSDAFGQGPVSAIPSSNKLAFTASQIVGYNQTKKTVSVGASDSAFNAQINKALDQEAVLPDAAGGFGQNAKELLGHVRVPFLLSDDFSFDIGGSWSIGGIAEPSNIIGTYTGDNGALKLEATGTQANGPFVAKSGQVRSGLIYTNRSIFGADAQFYLSMLPIGGSIVKAELYTGQTPFYGSANLFTQSDFTTLGSPTAFTIYKKVMGYYAMLVQNVGDNFQVALRYDVFDPNTDVEGTNFVTIDAGKDDTLAAHVKGLRGVRGAGNLNGTVGTGFGEDLTLSTLSIALNAFVSGNLRLTVNYDHPMAEDYTRAVSYVGSDSKTHYTVQTVTDQHDDRFTFRMQYKF